MRRSVMTGSSVVVVDVEEGDDGVDLHVQTVFEDGGESYGEAELSPAEAELIAGYLLEAAKLAREGEGEGEA